MRKIFKNLLVAGIVIVFALAQSSCSTSRKSAVPCPDFSHSRNMKKRHAQAIHTGETYTCGAIVKIT
jgi:hypothetical protein